MSSLDKYRNMIDAIDDKILDLLNERAEHVKSVGMIKKGSNSPVWVPSRESSIYERLTERNKGRAFPTSAIRPIFREIISASLSLEDHLKIGYLGPEGTFSNLAALKQFGSSAKLMPTDKIADVFMGVERGWYNYGIIPIENSVEGVVNYSIDLFVDSDVNIVGEILVEINHNLLSMTGDKNDIKSIYSHPQALAQCRDYIDKNFGKGIVIHEIESTSKAAVMAQEDKSIAAIGSKLCEVIYNLKVVERSIQDSSSNLTRFLIIGKDFVKPTSDDKTSIMFSVMHKSGTLYSALEVFNVASINMSKIESRPSKRIAWEYLFFVDIDGHRDDSKIQDVIDKLKSKLPLVKILGSYPKGILE